MTLIEVRGAPEPDELAAVLAVLRRLDHGREGSGGLAHWRAERRAALAESPARPRAKGRR